MKSKAAPVYPFLPLIQEGVSSPHKVDVRIMSQGVL